MRGMRFFFGVFFLFAGLHAGDFEQLVGSPESVRTAEDWEHLSFYKRLYEKSLSLPLREKEAIPAIFHLIWLGPEPYPKASLARLRKWQKLHPGWTFYFWSDCCRQPPFPSLALRSVVDFEWELLGSSYDAADTLKEKAFLLGLEILLKEGGVVIDHDVVFKQPLSEWSRRLDFFGILEPPESSYFSSSLFISSHLLAGRPRHPFFKEAAAWYQRESELYGRFFPGDGPKERVQRTRQRMYEAMRHGEKALGSRESRDCLFPAGLVTRHFREGSWTAFETIREERLRKSIDQLDGKVSLAQLLLFGALFLMGTVFLARRRR